MLSNKSFFFLNIDSGVASKLASSADEDKLVSNLKETEYTEQVVRLVIINGFPTMYSNL